MEPLQSGRRLTTDCDPAHDRSLGLPDDRSPTRTLRDCTRNRDDPVVEVNVAPPQRAQLTTARAGVRCEYEEREHVEIVSGGLEKAPDLGRRRGRWLVGDGLLEMGC